MDQDRFTEIESAVAGMRNGIENDSETAHAIDRNDAWAIIAACAEREGYYDIAALCNRATLEWFED